jgi:hypothetical protein
LALAVMGGSKVILRCFQQSCCGDFEFEIRIMALFPRSFLISSATKWVLYRGGGMR